jgi:hypothetical protein
MDGVLDPIIQNQITDSHTALELRRDLSRSRKKRPEVPMIQIKRASDLILFSFGKSRRAGGTVPKL